MATKMYILTENAGGFGLVSINGTQVKAEDPSTFETLLDKPDSLKLRKWSQFTDTTSAVEETCKMLDGKLTSTMKKLLKGLGEDETLFVADKTLASTIKSKLGIDVRAGNAAIEMSRIVKRQFFNLVDGISEQNMKRMNLSLSHGLARYRLQFSPEKVDQMVIQAVGLLDDLDRELNTFAMRLKEWYGWHFPELVKIVGDNKAFAETVLAIGFRTNVKHKGDQLQELLGEEMSEEVRIAAEISMGTEVTEEDITRIKKVAECVLELSKYREQLADYLKVRMEAIAPNLTYMVGELVASRLIAHAGSLVNLAKQPASTVQILGAEKALFRALKQRKPTPKYGLIYHAALIGQSAPKLKGTASRVLAAKLALNARYDAFGASAEDSPTIGISSKAYVEKKIAELSEAAALGTGGVKRPGKPIHNTPSYKKQRT